MDTTAFVDRIQRQHGFTPLGLMLRAFRGLMPGHARIVASALANDPFDLLAQDVPTWRWIRFLPAIDDRAADPGDPVRRGGRAMDSSVRLAEIDVDIERRPTHPAFLGSGLRRPVTHKWRRLDGLFGSALSPYQRVDGIVVCEPGDRALCVLRGSSGVLQADRPLVVVPLGWATHAAPLIDMLRARDYVIFDSFLRVTDPGQAPHPDGAGPAAWILALPGETAFTRMTRALFARHTPPATDASSWHALLGHQLELEAGSGGILFEPHGTRRELTISIGSEAPRWGFHAVESDGDAVWSWIGPRPRAGIVLPPLATRLDRLRLKSNSSIDPCNVAGLRASIDGEPVQVRARGAGSDGHFELIPAHPSASWRPWHLLEISMPLSRRPSEEDARLLALSVESVTLVGPAA